MLQGDADFDDEALTFRLHRSPAPAIRPGRYRLIARGQTDEGGPASAKPASPAAGGEFVYRLGHPLGEHVLAEAKACATPSAVVEFDITQHPARISVVEQRKGQAGYLVLQHLRIDAYESEYYLLFSAVTDVGEALDPETCARLFSCAGRVVGESPGPASPPALAANARRHAAAAINAALERSNRHFQEAREQLEKWAEDMELAANKELDDVKQQIKLLNRQARQAITVEEQRAIQEQIRKWRTRSAAWRARIPD